MRVIATGGTIANSTNGRLTPDQLLATLPGRDRFGRVDAEAIANVESTALTLADWVRLSKRIRWLFSQEPALDGIVVTTGTDTLEELAWFLYLSIPAGRPVVVAGAMRPLAAPDADGPANLSDAIQVARAPASRGLGTVVVLQGQILAPRDVEKRHTTSLAAFDTAAERRLGDVRAGLVEYTNRPPGGLAPGALAPVNGLALPRVDVLLTYQGATGDLLHAAVRAGARGLVLASAGAGSLTPSQLHAARRIVANGVPVVVSSRVGGGPVVAPAGARGLVGAGALPAVKARVLLMLALARGMRGEEIARVFREAGAGN